ncbi:amino acid adenylation domain-containing protein [Zhouia spongiae]|uniref:Amino acid adenylation domain-containing protein n=1 Tax=Zhouia spongiae TaxID=2202721 RepID=A0ABY3YKE1_9FLAO|nr:non-ribosomal peptide synthetase/type I polyketide synthase [Zhouia spongiae]UNY98311.1 amino acid adenylation domain-containing protein [Zhouia spongiae]
MNEILELVRRCNSQGIFFNYFNDELSIELEDESDLNDYLNEIKQNKHEIILLFKNCRPLSFSQERLWFIDKFNHNASYNLPVAVKLKGNLDIPVLKRTFLEIVKRHEILRTNFVTINEIPWQYINEESKFEFKIVDQTHLKKNEVDQITQELIEKEAQKPFDLANDSLIRLIVFKVGDTDHRLFLNKHHIISDGWSFSIFIKEISTLYEAFCKGKISPLPDLEIQYSDFAVWQRDLVQGEKFIEKVEYWKNKLNNTPILELPIDKTRPVRQTFNGSSLHFTLDKPLTKMLKSFSQINDLTLFMTLTSLFKVLLNKYTGQNDICVGSPIANRTRKELEPLLGFFANMLALRTSFDDQMTFIDLVRQVKQTTLDAYENQDIPFEKVVDVLKLDRNLTYSPLFQVALALQNNPVSELYFGELNLQPIEFTQSVSRFDLTLIFKEEKDELIGTVEYNTDLFEKDSICRFIDHFKIIVNSIMSNPECKISDIELLTSSERQQLLFDWNDTQVDYPKEKCIHQLFEEQSEKTPDNVAVVFEGDSLTYRELNERSNQLAYYLQSKGVKAESLVGICVERSLEMIVGLLGILKAGGAYVPIDPTYPEERISYMFKDTNCAIVLTQEQIELPKTNSEIIYLDSEWEKIAKAPRTNIETGVKGDNLAYVIYTSGSTGKPKGVMNQHDGLVNRLNWAQEVYKLQKSDVVLQKTTYCFDVSVWELFWPIIVGSKLVIAKPNGHKDTQYLIEIIRKESITTLHFVPSLLQVMIDTPEFSQCKSLKNILCSGEVLPLELVKKFHRNFDIPLHNLYGPTEAAIDVSSYVCEKVVNHRNIPIGRPVANTQLYILDQYLKPIPVGIPGELCIAGIQVARGYLNQPDLTRKKFIKDPFSKDPNSRLYKTGDLARYLPDGNIEFIGRLDDQVKIRGFRIELGEIESVLNQQDQVSSSVVLAKEDASGNKQLVGYVVPDSYKARTIFKLREIMNKGLRDTGPYILPNKMPLFYANRSETDFLYKEIYEEMCYLQHGIKLKRNGNIIDIGANIGMYSILMSQIMPSARIYAYEPIPQIYDVLQLNASLYSDQINVFNYGIGKEKGEELFTYYPNVSILSGMKNNVDGKEISSTVKKYILSENSKESHHLSLNNYDLDLLLKNRLKSEEFKCEIVTISDIIKKNKLKTVNLLKIDAENSEIDILKGISAEDWSKIEQIIVEVHDTGNRINWVVSLLKNNGFIVKVNKEVNLNDTNIYNVFALKNPIKDFNYKSCIDNIETNKGYYNEQEFIKDLRNTLSKTLPDYMVPSLFVSLEAMPLTSNGKIDKRALPDPRVKAEEDYIAPSNDLEDRIVELWSDVLGVNKSVISINKSFFELGGNSLLSVKLQQKLNQLDEFENIQVSDLFKHHTIKRLVESVNPERLTEYKLQRNIQTDSHEVAIIGMSGAFSGVDNVTEFWDLIKNQDEGVRSYSREECEKLGSDLLLFEDPDYIPVSGHVKDIDQFDPLFWDISPNEAKLIDPQIRKFIEHCWFVLESSGYIDLRKEANIGVFAGSGNSSYLYNNILNGEMASHINLWEASNANSKDALATKTSYMLGLSGPSNSVNTACSTGLVSVVEACNYLRLGTCEMALAGGVSLAHPNQIGYTYQEGMISSKDGHCRTFDETASGTIGGSGVGVVLLKRLEDAIKDEDNIIGVIKGYASNNDGDRKTDYTAPSITGQAECIINAQRMAGVSSDQIGYVECHGTATNLGDPIEVQALKEAFEFNSLKERGSKPGHKTVLGAVKANIGHADAAAGTAGLIKACLMLQNDIIPGQPNFNVPNPKLNLDQTNFEIVKQNRSWGSSLYDQRIIGVSSFGIGGTNAHVVIGDYLPGIKSESESKTTNLPSKKGDNEFVNYVVPISAKSKESLEFYKQELIKLLGEAHEDLRIEDLAFTLQEKREHYNYRSAYCGKDIKELLNNLQQYGSTKRINTEQKNKIVFMFPGQGSQYPCMGKELYDNDPYFKASIDKLIALANEHLEVDLYDVMYPELGNEQYDINETRWAQISIFIIEYAFAEYIEKLGIRADGYIGHSLGEYVAATLSGVFSLEDAIKVVIARGELMQSMELGSMLAVNTQEESIRTIVETHECEIAAINSIEDIVVTGSDTNINTLKLFLDEHSISSVVLNTSHAYHSRMMEEASIKFERVFDTIELNTPTKYFATNLNGEIAKEEVSKVSYWSDQLRNAVQFSKGIHSLSEYFNNKVNFIEVGLGKGLSSFVDKYKRNNSKKTIHTVHLLPSKKENTQTIKKLNNKEDILAKFWTLGIVEKPNDLKLFKHANKLTSLPTYQFNNKTCWLEMGSPQVVKKYNSIEEIYYERSWERIKIPSTIGGVEDLRHKNILILVNEKDRNKSNVLDLINNLKKYCDHIDYVVDQQSNKIISDLRFDMGDASHIDKVLNEKTRNKPLDLVIYISSTVDIDNPCLDILAIRNTFDWALKTHNRIPKFISVTYDNYEVIGNEVLEEKPSIVSGVTKSIPFEYFSMDTTAYHVDLSSIGLVYNEALISTILGNKEKEIIAVRGKYKWIPKYQQVAFSKENFLDKKSSRSNNPVFMITGGLGGVGYAYANYLTQKEEKCTIILLGRTKKSNLKEEYKTRLNNLIETGHKIIYESIDIGLIDAVGSIEKILENNGINTIEMVLHSAGVAAKSAINDKTNKDIVQVVRPKVLGVEHLLNLAESIKINYLVSCSSLSSVMPSLGQMEYTAANMYLDELSYRSHTNINCILAVNLNQISDTGMAVDFIKENSSSTEKSSNSIKSHQFPAVLDVLLQAKTIHNILLSRQDLNELLSENTNLLTEINRKAENVSNVKIKEEEYSETEYRVAQIWHQVLGVEEIGLHDNFFELGGHSLIATQMISQIRNELNIKLSLNTLFKNPDLLSFSKIITINTAKQEGKFFQTSLITNTDLEQLPEIVFNDEDKYKPFPLTAVQQSYWIGRSKLYDLGGIGMHTYSESYLEELDIKRLNEVINYMIKRHDMLRMVVTEDGQQRILEKVEPYEIQIHDFRGTTQEEEKQLFLLLRDKLSHQLFSGHEWPLFDISVCIFRDGTYKLLSSIDGLIFDASSSGIFMKEIISFYKDISFNPPKLALSFRDYVIAEQSLKSTKLYNDSKQYWLDRINEIPKAPELPLAKLPSEIGNVKFRKQRFELSSLKWGILKDVISSAGVTPTVFIIQCFAEIMHRWNKLEHFTLNLTLFNRLPFHEEVNRIIGDFTSLNLLEIDYRKPKDFKSRLKDTQFQLWSDLENRHFNGIEVQRKLSQSTGYTVTMPIVVTSTLGIDLIDNEDDQLERSSHEKVLYDIKHPYAISQTPQVWIDCQIIEKNGGLQIDWDSVKELFPEGMLEDMFGAFERLLTGFIEDKDLWDSRQIELLPRHQVSIQSEANNSTKEYPNKLIHEPFIEQVRIRGEKAAIRTSTKTISYLELYQKSVEVGEELKYRGAKPNHLIAIIMDKGWEQVVTAMGVQFSGAAYMPIDASLPKQRILHLLEIGEVSIVVSLSSILDDLSLPNSIQTLIFDEMQFENRAKVKNIANQGVEDLAYVIFTSGSSGEPKGVMIDHQGAVNTILDINSRFGITEEDSCFAISSLSFDLSVYDVFGILSAGGTIVIPKSSEQKDPKAWESYIEKENITIWNSVPAQLQMLVEYNGGNNKLSSLRKVLLSGDWIPVNLPDRIKDLCPGVEVISLGGATEASIWSIYYPIGQVGADWKSIPYGKPLANQSFYVLKPDLTVCPQWVPGDLYIGGKGLALGYWRDKKKTVSSFIIHPENGERLYKTGDVGRYLPDGNIEFLGRLDDQVKIRGFRIELGEIESVLNQQDQVSSSVVLAKEDASGNKQLVGYVVPSQDVEPSQGLKIDKLREALSKTLPDYMVPSLFVSLEAMPLTSNGKIDKKALPDLQGNLQMTKEYVAPKTEIELKLVSIWQELLGIEKIGVHDDFFELGGHSLLITRVNSKIKTEFNNDISLDVLFKNSTIFDLSKQIKLEGLDKKKLSLIQRFNNLDNESNVDFEEVEF